MKQFLIFLILGSLYGCATSPAPTSPVREEVPHTSSPSENAEPSPIVVNLDELQAKLQMDLPVDQLGYKEKLFNTCQVDSGYSSTQNCQGAVFVLINFQLLCRDSEGTISTTLTRDDLTPLSGRKVRWLIKNHKGSLTLNGEGEGQIRFVAVRSVDSQRLRITVDNDFLVQQASEVQRIIAPKNWCN